MATGDTCKSFLPHESAVCQDGTRLGPTVPLDGCGLHSIVKGARTFEPLLLPLPLYDKSAQSPHVERMRPLS